MTDTDKPGDKKPARKLRRSKIPSTSDTATSAKTEPASNEKAKARSKISIDEPQVNVPVEENVYFDPNETKDTLRRYFLVTFFTGSAFILTPLPNFLDSGSGHIRIVVSTILMGVYYFLGRKYTKSANTRAVFADSLYYLGFLFTFVALVGAMLQLNDLNIQVIIGKMGPALVTTVIGMAARIYLTQFEPITSEPETEALNTLGALTSDIISALKQLDEGAKNNAKVMENFQKQSADQMTAFTKKLNDISTARLEEDFIKLGSAISGLTIAGKNLSEAANRTQFIVEDAKTKFDGLGNIVTDAKRKLADAEELSGDIEKLNQTVTNASERITEVSERMETKVSLAATEVGSSVTRVLKEVNKTEEEAKKLGENLNKTVTDVVDFLNNPRK